MLPPRKRSVWNQATAWLVLGAVLFVLGWRGLVVAARHFKEPPVVRELCAVRQFEQDLTPNHANTRLVFCEDTEEGVGIYFWNADGAKPRLLCEQKEKGIRGRRFSMLGWAPDDSLLACAWPDNPHDQEFILIFDGRTGKLLDKIGADPSLEQLAWLSPGAFAYSAAGTSVRVVERQGGGSWVHKRYFGNVATNLDNFVAVPPDSVAWRDRNAIWRLNLDFGKPEKIWEATTNRLVEFTTAPDVSGFLLNCSDDLGQYLLWFDPEEKSTVDYGRISNQQNYVRNAVWLDHGTSYAYLTNISAGSAFCIKTGQMEQPVTVPWNGGVRNLTLNGSRLFFAGNPDGQTPGIWEYDIPSQTFKLLDSSAGSPPNDSIGNPPVCHTMTNSFGEQRFYHFWTPLHAAPNNKYPLLLAQELNSWFACFRIAAASGCFVAVVDRPFFNTWNGNPEHSWVEDVNGLYEIMARNPQIDTNRVYLYACSRETSFLSLLMNEQPALAQGAILFNPTGLPDVSALQDKRMLVVDGKLDGHAVTRLSEFQDRAVQAGNSVALFLQNGSGHVSASGKTVSDQARQFARFMVDGQ